MPVRIESKVSLRPYNSFGVEARATHFARVASVEELIGLVEDPHWRAMPRLVLGGGSNVLFTGDFDGLVIKVAIMGIEVLETQRGRHRVRIGAGENWHATVERLLVMGQPGLENLALIPGNVGAAPIQNIGAYGVELAERFESLDAYDSASHAKVTLDAEQCRFGYRDSVFKQEPGRYVVLDVTLSLPVDWRPVAG
jgi:UDP-N-acetylmuramate dehydrogenase